MPIMVAAGIAGFAGLMSGRSQNKANSAQALRQMEFQERMSSTAHQREVTDLKAAGLNPILSGTGGQGASSPGGAQATMGNPMSTAIDHATSALNMKQIRATTNLTEANETVAAVSQQKILQDKNESLARENLLKLQIPEAEAGADVYKSTGSFMKYLKGLGLDASSARGLLQLFLGRGKK